MNILDTGQPNRQASKAEIRDSRAYERFRWEYFNACRKQGRYDLSESEIYAAFLAKPAELADEPAVQSRMEVEQTEAEPVVNTRLASMLATTSSRARRREQIYDLLEASGAVGMTREDIAIALSEVVGKPIKDGSVSSPIWYLLDPQAIIEIGTRHSSAGHDVAVLKLAKYGGAR